MNWPLAGTVFFSLACVCACAEAIWNPQGHKYTASLVGWLCATAAAGCALFIV